MPNGYDKNWVRACAAIEGFRARFGHWPTEVLINELCLDDLAENVFTPITLQTLRSRIKLTPLADMDFVATDDQGHRYSYKNEGFPEGEVESAEQWLGVAPDRDHDGY